MILVTGHRGFIGSRLFSKLEGAVGIDVQEGRNVLSCLPQNRNVTLIYHLAAQSSVEPSWDDPVHDMDNIRMTVRLAHTYPMAKIVYANSCASINVNSPYGFSKWASGEYLKKFHENYVSCVFPNVYGQGEDGKSVVDIFRGRDNVTVFGDGLQIRDYVHVDDIVEGLLLAQNWPVGEYFMGSGISTNVLDLAQGKTINFAPPRKEDREVVVPNTTPDWLPKTNVLEYLNA